MKTIKKAIRKFTYGLILALGVQLSAAGQLADAGQSRGGEASQKVVIVTGARFSYQLVQRWIDEFNSQYPEIQVIIESRGSSDPQQYDVLAEVYEHDEVLKQTREYIRVARYAILPVATSESRFARIYHEKGLDNKLIKQIFFHNIFADESEKENIEVPYTVYTRFQKAGAPIVFAKYYGFEHKDINGKAIAGSDEHLLKALLRDSTGVSYLPTPLIYDVKSRLPAEGLTVIPIDLDGNGKVKGDERNIYDSLDHLIQALEVESRDKRNLPMEYLHLSVDKRKASDEALKFLKWVDQNGHHYLKQYGYLSSGWDQGQNKDFNEFVSRKGL